MKMFSQSFVYLPCSLETHRYNKVKAKADLTVSTTDYPPKNAMDFACAAKRGDIIDLLSRHGARGLCKKGEKGGFVPR